MVNEAISSRSTNFLRPYTLQFLPFPGSHLLRDIRSKLASPLTLSLSLLSFLSRVAFPSSRSFYSSLSPSSTAVSSLLRSGSGDHVAQHSSLSAMQERGLHEATMYLCHFLLTLPISRHFYLHSLRVIRHRRMKIPINASGETFAKKSMSSFQRSNAWLFICNSCL